VKAGLDVASENNEVLYGDAIIGAGSGRDQKFADVAGGRRECVVGIGGESRVSACIDTYDLVGLRGGISKVDLVPAQRIDPLGPVPPYRQIAAIIKRGIVSGQYPADTRIPTESELVETFEVARSTARRAVAALREEGLVYTVPARGTYVAKLERRGLQA
jgi:hypothetical protein